MPNLDELIKTIKESQKTLFILCGFPYAGKSFVAEELRKRTDIVCVSIDAIFGAHGFDWDTNTLPDTEAWQKIFDESHEKTKAELKTGKNVLYDSTNQTITSRDRLREVASTVGGDACVIYIKSSMETVWNRWEENQKNQTRSVVSKELMQMTIDMFEEPTVNESVLVIENYLFK
ncbi:MAG: AAA family ATPase [Candidatus Pacebacteria bacterium]|nr:AAA family ATPase [Candidatus Paceibacterota bacterium]